MSVANNNTSSRPNKETSRSIEAGHTISINKNGIAYGHCHNRKVCNNELGQLGRIGDAYKSLPIKLQEPVSVSRVYTGGFASSGHSALLDERGNLWLSGCDRWQQLGLGSSNSGSGGYTWTGGKLWQDQFQKNEHVVKLLQSLDPSLSKAPTKDNARRWIRDVSLGGDHTVILSANKRDVITFGKGGEGQLGLSSKPWVSSPSKSKQLSSSNSEISAVCAFKNCSMTLNDKGEVMKKAGKCSLDLKGMKKALDACRKRAKEIDT